MNALDDLPCSTNSDVSSQRSTSDASLLRMYCRGDDDAATALYLRYAARMRAVADSQASNDLRTRLDADDLVQSIFRTFFRRAADGQYTLPEGDALWRLLLVIGLNKIRAAGSYHRADKRSVRKTWGGEAASIEFEHQTSEDETHWALLRLTIDELLAPYPQDYRHIVELRIAGHEVAEISHRCGRSKRSVERILQEFRHNLDAIIHACP